MRGYEHGGLESENEVPFSVKEKQRIIYVFQLNMLKLERI